MVVREPCAVKVASTVLRGGYHQKMIFLPSPVPLRALFIPLFLGLCCAGAQADVPPDSGVHNSRLDSTLFYELLVGEMSVLSGDDASAYSLMLDAARRAESQRLYARAVDIALRARSGQSALDAARAWVHSFPTSADANRYLLQILVGLNRQSEVRDALKRYLAALPVLERIAVLRQLPPYFAHVADKPQIAATVEQALAADLTNPVTGPAAWIALGELRKQAANAKGALEAAQKALTLAPASPEAGGLAIALMDAQLPQAEALVQRFLSDHTDASVRMGYVRQLLAQQRYADATRQAQILTEQNPQFAEGWLLRGSLELDAGQNGQARTALSTYVTLLSGQDANASETTPEGLEQAYLLLAQLAQEEGKLDQAKDYLAQIHGNVPSLRAQTRLALILAQQGRLDEALALIRQLPEQHKGDARSKLGAEVQILRDNGRYAEAYKALQQALVQYPNDADLLYDQALIADKLGQSADMEQILRRILATTPDYYPAYNALGYWLADHHQRLPEARQLVQKALAFAPNDAYIIDSLGWVEFRDGHTTLAMDLLQKAFKARPDAEIAAHLGEVLWTLNQRDQARAVWKEGSALNASNETLQETMRRLQGAP